MAENEEDKSWRKNLKYYTDVNYKVKLVIKSGNRIERSQKTNKTRKKEKNP